MHCTEQCIMPRHSLITVITFYTTSSSTKQYLESYEPILAPFQTPQRSRSSVRIDITSGKRGVTLQSNGVGWLIVRTSAALALSVLCVLAWSHLHN